MQVRAGTLGAGHKMRSLDHPTAWGRRVAFFLSLIHWLSFIIKHIKSRLIISNGTRIRVRSCRPPVPLICSRHAHLALTQTESIIQNGLTTHKLQQIQIWKKSTFFLKHGVGRWRKEIVKQKKKKRCRHAQACARRGGKETTLPWAVVVWGDVVFSLPLAVRSAWLLAVDTGGDGGRRQKKFLPVPSIKRKSSWRLNGTIGASRVMRPQEELSQDFCKKRVLFFF